ncbi:MAG: hypothetical protein ACRCXT_16360 [Paraclostridium sp.]
MKKKFKIIGIVCLMSMILLSGLGKVSFVNNNYFGMSDKLQNAFVEELKDNNRYYWSRHDAYKWISSYKVLDIDKTNFKTYDINVEFLWKDREGKQETSNEVLTINLK